MCFADATCRGRSRATSRGHPGKDLQPQWDPVVSTSSAQTARTENVRTEPVAMSLRTYVRTYAARPRDRIGRSGGKGKCGSCERAKRVRGAARRYFVFECLGVVSSPLQQAFDDDQRAIFSVVQGRRARDPHTGPGKIRVREHSVSERVSSHQSYGSPEAEGLPGGTTRF